MSTTTTDTQRLYYGFSKDELAYPSRIDRDRWDNYVITISNGTELREHCRAIAEAEHANADRIEHALGELFSWLGDGDHEEVGTVEEEGWYEPPHYNYADPSAAYDAEGGLTSAVVKLTYPTADTAGGAYHILDEVIGFMLDDEVIDSEEEIALRTCQKFISRWVAEKVHEFDRQDVHED